MRKVLLVIKVPAELKEKVALMASNHGVSMSEEGRVALSRHVKSLKRPVGGMVGGSSVATRQAVIADVVARAADDGEVQ